MQARRYVDTVTLANALSKHLFGNYFWKTTRVINGTTPITAKEEKVLMSLAGETASPPF